MPPLDGPTIGIILAGVVSLVTALGTIQTRRDAARRRELAALRTEVASFRRVQLSAVRWIYAAQLVLAARGVPENALPPLSPELEALFRGDPDDDDAPGDGPDGDLDTDPADAEPAGRRARHRYRAEPA